MSNIKGPPADVTFTISITRKATGLVETYQMEGYVLSEPPIEATAPEGEPECQQP